MGDGFFPVAFDHLKAEIDYLNTVAHGVLDLDGVLIDSIRLNHPQGGLAFRFREGNHTMVFITDNELGAARGKRIPEFVEFVRGCDLLIHDAQYLPEEISERRGWGHSTYDEVMALAKEAKVHNLLLTHHDPCRSDGDVEKIVGLCRDMVAAHDNPHYVDAAREGACYRLP
jgi:ribonuclease BN (tRNA processing enzyme)